MKNILSSLFLLLALWSFAQTEEVYVVTAPTLNVRSGSGTNYEIIYQLKEGQEVIVVSKSNSSWFKIDLGYQEAYVSSRYLTNDPDWTRRYLSTGSDPDCNNISPRYDTEMDNYLRVNAGSNTDVVIKLINMNHYGYEQCMRIVYIRAGDSYNIRNIPEGKYYLKIAYGKDWRQKIVDGKCYGKFMRRALYEKGDEVLDFNLQKTYDGYNIPSYELSLDVVATDLRNDFQTNEISEAEFNN